MDRTDLRIDPHAPATDVDFVEAQINRFNMRAVGAYDAQSLAIVVRDAQATIVAGITGYTWAGLCEIQFLWVAEALRGHGQGSALLAAAEHEAARRGCRTMLLTTYSFQAPLFYQRHGYSVAGRVPDCPPGHTSFTLTKALAPEAHPHISPAPSTV